MPGALSWEAVTEDPGGPSQSAVALGRRFGVSDSARSAKSGEGSCTRHLTAGARSETGDRAGWGLAFYTGMRRSEIGRAQWQQVFWDADELMVAASKSDAGEGRRVPMVGPLKKILNDEWVRRGPAGEWADRRPARSTRASGRPAPTKRGTRPRSSQRVTLHEARHTYASFLMAAGYNLKQIQEYLGHADLVTTGRYIKNLPVPRGTTARAEARRLSGLAGRRRVKREYGHKYGHTCHALLLFVGVRGAPKRGTCKYLVKPRR